MKISCEKLPTNNIQILPFVGVGGKKIAIGWIKWYILIKFKNK
ncbi:MAG: hypothetical protein ACOC1K_07880 [Nanoarchaeota archaeon]